jgi:hypothetical protein
MGTNDHILEQITEMSQAIGRIEGKINNGLSDNIKQTKEKVEELHDRLITHIADEDNHMVGIRKTLSRIAKGIGVLGVLAGIATGVISGIKYFEQHFIENAITEGIKRSK